MDARAADAYRRSVVPMLADALALQEPPFPCAVFRALFLITLSPTRTSAWKEAVLEHAPCVVVEALADAEALAYAAGELAVSGPGEGAPARAAVPRNASDIRAAMLMAVGTPCMDRAFLD